MFRSQIPWFSLCMHNPFSNFSCFCDEEHQSDVDHRVRLNLTADARLSSLVSQRGWCVINTTIVRVRVHLSEIQSEHMKLQADVLAPPWLPILTKTTTTWQLLSCRHVAPSSSRCQPASDSHDHAETHQEGGRQTCFSPSPCRTPSPQLPRPPSFLANDIIDDEFSTTVADQNITDLEHTARPANKNQRST